MALLWYIFVALLATAYSKKKGDRKQKKLSKELMGKELPACVSGDQHKRLCSSNDTYCGKMNLEKREWKPEGCKYRDVTVDQARKCMGSRVLACLGDNMMRDLCMGVASFLSGVTPQMASKLHLEDFSRNDAVRYENTTIIRHIASWKENAGKNGFVIPKIDGIPDKTAGGWQVQIWNIYGRKMLRSGQAEMILSNKMPEIVEGVRKIDFALWNHGLNDWGWWREPPHGSKFYNLMTGAWLKIRDKVEVPSVWTSMNPVCREWMINTYMNGNSNPAVRELAFSMVEEANHYVHEKLFEQGLPYFDSAQVFRSPQRCELSGSNGLYARMWVDIVRAKMLFNHLCDEDFNWVAAAERF